MIWQYLKELIRKYLPCGIQWGNELALPPETALRFADDLAALDVAITGVDGWWTVEQKGIAPALEVDLSIADEILQGANRVKESVSIAKDFILNHLSLRTSYVSFTLGVPLDWKLFPLT